ncbi:MAG: hypothetical protein JXR03_02255 [Cyclobacteriaceae bacterium]
MIRKYLFCNEFVGFSEEGIHLLRNKYCYKEIKFFQVIEVEITEGRSVNNWFFVLSLGLALGLISLILSYLMIRNLIIVESSPRQANFVGHMLLAGIVLGGLGFYFIYGALKKVPVMYVFEDSEKYRIRLEKLEKDLIELVGFLRDKDIKVREVTSPTGPRL